MVLAIVTAIPKSQGYLIRHVWMPIKRRHVITWRVGVPLLMALLAWFVWARSSAGWPGSLGFGDDKWPEYWVAFWSAAVTAAIVSMAAGIYLSNRDRAYERLAEKLRAKEQVVLLQDDLARALLANDSAPLERDRPVKQVISRRKASLCDVIRARPWRGWRDQLPDQEPFFAALESFDWAYTAWDSAADELEQRLTDAIRVAADDIVDDAMRRLTVSHKPESADLKAFALGVILALEPQYVFDLLMLRKTGFPPWFWAEVWNGVRERSQVVVPDLGNAIEAYQKAYERLVGAVEQLRVTLAA